MRRSRKIGQRGFTIVEALIAAAVFAVGMASTASMLTMSMKTAQSSALDAHAVILGQQELENVRSLKYASMATHDVSAQAFGGATFSVHCEVQTDQPAANMKTVNVTVSWSERGQAKTYLIASIFTNVTG
jgi:prepilin-type N-terminal cleavage/methylation domain-containing protein